ncbi:MAG: outer membrane beta-barrel protein [Pseudomonadota bacterium]
MQTTTMKPIVYALIAFTLAWSSPAVQADSLLSFHGVYGISDIDGISLIDESLPVDRPRDDPQSVTGLGLELSHQFGEMPIRLGLEYTYRFRYDVDIFSVESNPRLFRVDVETHSLHLNGYYDIDLDSDWQAIVGGGIGYVLHRLDTESLRGSVNPSVSNSENDLGWNLTLGLRKALNERWNFDLRYRYSDLGSFETGVSSLGGVEVDDYFSHDILIGFSYDLP